MLELLYSLDTGGIPPLQATDGSAAFDLFVPEDQRRIAVVPRHVTHLDLRVRVAIPEGHCGIMLPRSGLGSKKAIALANTFGLIDSDYRGNLIAKLVLGPAGTEKAPNDPVLLRAWEPILQLVILPIPKLQLHCQQILPDPGTRQGGFGSTTKQSKEKAHGGFNKDNELSLGEVDGKAGGKSLDSGPDTPPSGSEK